MIDVEAKRQREIKVVNLMIGIYCRKKHHTKKGQLCEECKQLSEYATLRTSKCPFMATKTFCSRCKVHCYRPDMKLKIKEVMKFSGPRMMIYHPILALKHGYYTLKDNHRNKKLEKQQKKEESKK
jgi:hypothetical protein